IIALFIALMTTALVPVDIFLVSYMKNDDGSWKPWSANRMNRDDIEETAVATTYYILYALLAFFVFVIIPFMYFFFEERDEDITTAEVCIHIIKHYDYTMPL
ncbi:predicted protein, partial [Nematostella vectensis]